MAQDCFEFQVALLLLWSSKDYKKPFNLNWLWYWIMEYYLRYKLHPVQSISFFMYDKKNVLDL